ncbi:hypothetical protein [Aequorivita viscosa]|uniref:Uncharacterized protein n=1 Tax=Aequorivita viscosa TaxID=797419 RepID=A0A1M6PUB2_9FLAO|nr:hypothetical protein [Aequorivita viscosa]SDX59011.1 hypothetical protein SAMN05216556_1591 [Aequorivita viscosa]SHK11522.1 hypothetical protein SAMN04487908_1611 [Aequorivita viscosa]
MISIFAFAILFIPVLLLSSQIDNSILQLVITALGIIGLFGILFYFSYGRLNVSCKNDTLHFEWQKKLLFDYAKIPDIKLNEIKCLVIDQGQILRKIITDKVEITLGNNRPNNVLKSDSQAFINFLSKEIQDKEIIDSWDIWVEKGFLKWALRINTMILIVVIGILGFFAVTKGFEKIPPASFFMLIFLLPQMILYQKQMKSKIKN